MSDELENVAARVERMSKEWDVDKDVLMKRAELAMRHKREIIDLCGSDDEMWHFEDYFSDLIPHKESIVKVYDIDERMKEVNEDAYKKTLATRELLKAVEEKLKQ